MWDVARSCFVCLNGPQHMWVIERAIRRCSGCILRLDAALLTKLLYSDDTAQADCDELLRRLRETAIGEYLAPFFSFPSSDFCDGTLLCFRFISRQHGVPR